MSDSLKVCLGYINKLLFQRKGLDNDITVKLEDGSQIHVYSPVIISQSKVFEKMLTAEMEEGKTKTIDMTAHKSETVRQLFEYFYSHEFDFDKTAIGDWFDFLDILGMFDLEAFYKKVEEDICHRCNVENVVPILVELLKRVEPAPKVYAIVKEILCTNLSKTIMGKRKNIYVNDVDWRKYGYTCFDQIRPGAMQDGVVLRNELYTAHLCCKHYNTHKKDYLRNPTQSLAHNGAYVCIAHTVDGTSQRENCVKIFCCLHGEVKEESDKLVNELMKQSGDVMACVFKMLFEVTPS